MNRIEQARAMMRPGKWNRLNHAIDQFKANGDDPDTGAYALCLGDLSALEAEMERAGQEP